MKYLILLGDGMADYPIDELSGKTPLEFAQTVNMDYLAKTGTVGTVKNIPDELPAGSDVAIMSVLGYDPMKYYTGRAALEGIAMGIELAEDEIANRCNLVTIQEGVMVDYSAGHISSEEGCELITGINNYFMDRPNVKFYPGVSYRHLMVLGSQDEKGQIISTPPHDIIGKKIGDYLPKGNGSEILRELIFDSQTFLEGHPINKHRQKMGKHPANMIWFWGEGRAPKLPTFQALYGISGAVISAVDLIKGLGKCAGLEIIEVPGVTGYYDTNYSGKAMYALNALKDKDFVFVHVEAPDEASHNGDLSAKIRTIETFDKEVVGTILAGISKINGVRILTLCDHETPISLKTHARGNVPFIIWGDKKSPIDDIYAYNEITARKSSLHFEQGDTLLRYFLG